MVTSLASLFISNRANQPDQFEGQQKLLDFRVVSRQNG